MKRRPLHNSLLVKFLAAFFLVILLSAVTIAWFASATTKNAFTLFTTRSGQAWAERLSPVLAEYYAAHAGWQGVETVFLSGIDSSAGPGSGLGPGSGGRQQSGDWSLGQRFLLADAEGLVIYDSTGEITGDLLSADELGNGIPISVDESLAGTLLVVPADLASPDSLAGQYIASVNRSIILAVVITGILSTVIGTGLFLQVTAPLRKLNKAASAVARGDLSQRVVIRSRDELADLGSTFNAMTESLERASLQRQRLMADIAHELRTPIAVIQANLEAMLDDVLPMDAGQVASLHDEVLLLNRLVGDLRLISLAEAGELRLEKQMAMIDVLIHKLVERFGVQAEQMGIRLVTDLPVDLPANSMDPDRITQVLNNLVGNALRYTPKNGTILIKAESLPAPAAFLRVSVSDSGPGIDPAILPHLFDRFFRGEQARTGSGGGSGLGLAIVKQLVEAHGGEVEAVSPIDLRPGSPGGGTRISFTLPLTD